MEDLHTSGVQHQCCEDFSPMTRRRLTYVVRKSSLVSPVTTMQAPLDGGLDWSGWPVSYRELTTEQGDNCDFPSPMELSVVATETHSL